MTCWKKQLDKNKLVVKHAQYHDLIGSHAKVVGIFQISREFIDSTHQQMHCVILEVRLHHHVGCVFVSVL